MTADSRLAVVVTGSTSGIVRATAQAFAGEGAAVVAHGLDELGSDEAMADVREAGGEPRFFPGDLRFPRGRRRSRGSRLARARARARV